MRREARGGAGGPVAQETSQQQDVPRRVFDSLFGVAGGLPPEGALREELRAVGFDPLVRADAYPLRTWRAAIDVARRHAYPQLPKAEGERTLARRFVDGFTRTPVGFVLKAVAPVFGLDRTLQSLPHYVRTVRSFMRLTVAQEGPGNYRILFDDPE